MRTIDQLTAEQRDAIVDHIASLCHEAIRTYNEAEGVYIPAWQVLKVHQKRESKEGVIWYLDNWEATAADSHNAWVDRKTAKGWIKADKKDTGEKTHPALEDFSLISETDQRKEHVFRCMVNAIIKDFLRKIH